MSDVDVDVDVEQEEMKEPECEPSILCLHSSSEEISCDDELTHGEEEEQVFAMDEERHQCSGWKDPKWPSAFNENYPWGRHVHFDATTPWIVNSEGVFFSNNCQVSMDMGGTTCDQCSNSSKRLLSKTLYRCLQDLILESALYLL